MQHLKTTHRTAAANFSMSPKSCRTSIRGSHTEAPAIVLFLLWTFCVADRLTAFPPAFTTQNGEVKIDRVSSECPIIYDNDWWKDTPDAAYLWAKASLGKADLRANIVSRDMWEWQNGYTYSAAQCKAEADLLYDAIQEVRWQGIPQPILGSDVALQKPASGSIEDTKPVKSPGVTKIIEEALRATRDKPLLIFAGGPCTSVANAYLLDPSIAETIVVFQVDGGGYNGKDQWSWEIVEASLPMVNWADGYFWGDWSQWNPARFRELRKSKIATILTEYAASPLGKANQWGDGPWLFELFQPRAIGNVSVKEKKYIHVAKEQTHSSIMEEEFFETINEALKP